MTRTLVTNRKRNWQLQVLWVIEEPIIKHFAVIADVLCDSASHRRRLDERHLRSTRGVDIIKYHLRLQSGPLMILTNTGLIGISRTSRVEHSEDNYFLVEMEMCGGNWNDQRLGRDLVSVIANLYIIPSFFRTENYLNRKLPKWCFPVVVRIDQHFATFVSWSINIVWWAKNKKDIFLHFYEWKWMSLNENR